MLPSGVLYCSTMTPTKLVKDEEINSTPESQMGIAVDIRLPEPDEGLPTIKFPMETARAIPCARDPGNRCI